MKALALVVALAGIASLAACNFGFPSGPAQSRSCHFPEDCPSGFICAIPQGQQVGTCELNVSVSHDRHGREPAALTGGALTRPPADT